jgi:UDP-N-acetylmuramyl pentapeptide phosphotransferase/UDP-N-acetylglucosamine-1-phosphate transferase
MPRLFFVIPVAFLLGASGAVLASKFGNKIGLVDIPNIRSSHKSATPRSGGIGIWIAFVLAGIFLGKYPVFTLLAGTIGLIGLLEDIFTLSPKLRLFLQLLISGITVSLFKDLYASVIAVILFLFWAVFVTGTTNFYNFMDGIDGIAGLTGFVGFGFLAIFCFYITNDPDIAIMSTVISMACLGFLPLNFPKAKVFMGDVGSVLLGFVFACFIVNLAKTINIFLCTVMFLCMFYADTIATIFYRWRMGENLIKAHRKHLYQYMSNELGLPHWSVVVAYASTQIAFGLLALLAYMEGLVWQFAVLVLFAILFLGTYKVVKNLKPRMAD